MVQRVFETYTVEGLSMGEITRRLNAEGIPTRKQSSRWERSVVWAMLRNPAYRGAAAFGKTRVAGRIRVTRALRRRGGIVLSNSIGHERPREEWIEIPVPALVSEESFAQPGRSVKWWADDGGQRRALRPGPRLRGGIRRSRHNDLEG